MEISGHVLLRARQRCFRQYIKESWPILTLGEWLKRRSNQALRHGQKHKRKNQEYKYGNIKFIIWNVSKKPRLITLY